MSDKPINDGGPAFPCIVSNVRAPDLPNGHQVGNFDFQMYGMTLRDYFAAQWLNGYIACSSATNMPMDEAAKSAYRIADAMLKAREA